jgi:hypothetical protein
MWEAERYDWARLRAQGSAAEVPLALDALQKARTNEEAERAYWQIDNTVVVQGALHEAAIATAACGVVALAGALPPGRAFILELLGQLVRGEASQDEVQAGGGQIRERCVAEIRAGLGIYVDLLERGDDEERGWCADLIGICAQADALLKDRALWHLRRSLEAVQNVGVRRLIGNWIDDLCRENAG